MLTLGGLTHLTDYFNLPPTFNHQVIAGDNATTIVSYLPSGQTLSPGENASSTYTITLAVKTGTATIDGLQLDILVKGNIAGVTAKPIVASGLVLVKNTSTAVTGGFQTKLMLLPLAAGQPVQFNNETGIVQLELQAQPGTNLTVEMKSGTSLTTLFRQSSTQVLSIPDSVNYQLRDNTPPTPSVNPTFQLTFSQQGLSGPGVILATELALKSPSSGVQKFNVRSKSGTEGLLTLETPLDLSSSDLGKTYQVFVKTPTTLMKKLGEITIRSGTNQAPTSWSQTRLLVGDLDNAGSAANIISIADIAKMLSVYTQLQTPVTAQTALYDVNFDGRIDIADVALVLSNFTTLQVVGDTP